ncbi:MULTISPECIES: hypothetical protein [Arthrobacter]|nr:MULTISPECIES: hypothetical protein [Arthrobacter]NYG17019.1 hypothetical protein [Arthrobacter psychrochitiniphilus]
MSTDVGVSWVLLGMFALLAASVAAASQFRRFRQSQMQRFWDRVGLPMGTDEINTSVARRLHRSDTAQWLGGLAGTLVAATVLLLTPTPGPIFGFSWLVVLPAFIIGMSTFDVALALRDSLFTKREDSPRMARAAAVDAADYMSPWRRATAPLLLALAVALDVTVLAMGAAGKVNGGAFLQSMALPFLVLALVVATGSKLVSQRMLQQPQPVSDPLELAWDDALRADTFRKLGQLSAGLAWLALAAAGLGLAEAIDPSHTSSLWSPYGELAISWGFIAIVMFFGYGGAYNYFRHRLWTNTAFAATTQGPAPSTPYQP